MEQTTKPVSTHVDLRYTHGPNWDIPDATVTYFVDRDAINEAWIICAQETSPHKPNGIEVIATFRDEVFFGYERGFHEAIETINYIARILVGGGWVVEND